MGLANIGWSGLVLILVALILVFGPSKLPEIGKSIGKTLLEFKTAAGGKNTESTQSHSKEEVLQTSETVENKE